MAFLLFKFAQTMAVRGLIGAPTDALPLRQYHIADATGLINVHVNRMIAKLRRDRILSGSGTVLEIVDVAGLRSTSGIKWLLS
ncbi:helix-turn-helix domain-containing protein [Sphingomonas sp. LB2R24]|uniref:helix-turn-helix domain-containing protein n=1 Tax=Sphingomonas sorbitolis TaxID=3096165 RepID=UPI003FA78D48